MHKILAGKADKVLDSYTQSSTLAPTFSILVASLQVSQDGEKIHLLTIKILLGVKIEIKKEHMGERPSFSN